MTAGAQLNARTQVNARDQVNKAAQVNDKPRAAASACTRLRFTLLPPAGY